MHPWHDINLPDNFPETVSAVIEIPRYSSIKYEMDIQTGLLKTERILPASIQWPDNYGFIPQTLGGDGDPIDIFVLSAQMFSPLTITHARPIGVMRVVDNNAIDSKIIAVDVTDSLWNTHHTTNDLPDEWLSRLHIFFKQYKTAFKKNVHCTGWGERRRSLPNHYRRSQYVQKSAPI